MELDFDKYCILDGSPTTVLPAPRRRSKAAYRKPKEKLECEKHDIFTLDEDFAEISFNRYRSASCRDVEAKRVNHELPKRGSVYQSSKEVNMAGKKNDGFVGRKKIELSRESASMGLTFGIIDSLCSSDEDRKRPMEESTSHFCKNPMEERNRALNLHKSLSAKLALPQSPARHKPDSYVKPRSKKSPLYCSKETISKPLVTDYSGNHNLASQSSPAHLHGILKSESKNGVSFFEFSLKSPEDVYYVAKTWKLDDALTWVYTFHSLDRNKRKSNASGWGFKDSSRESTMVGQMAVSCYLCTELKGAGAFNECMVTEYVLYDIAQSRRSTSSRDDSTCDITKTPLVSDCENNEVSAKTMNKGRTCKHSRPLAASELGPELETAAVIMRVPFEKRESLKLKSGDSKMNLCRIDEGICDNLSRAEMHVVVPSGNHGLPSGERRGPSSLLDRWRLGGGCECGGWDMGCPLDVFVNPDFQVAEGQPLMDNRNPVGLFVKGKKEDDIPAFSIRPTGDGKYAVDFHAQLTSLQAFSICVSILHSAEASTAVGHERSKLQSDSLRVFPEEEIKNLMEAISEEEKFKADSYNKKDEVVVQKSFVLNPPFSPIGRV